MQTYRKNLKNIHLGGVKLLGFIVGRKRHGNMSEVLREQNDQAGCPLRGGGRKNYGFQMIRIVVKPSDAN